MPDDPPGSLRSLLTLICLLAIATWGQGGSEPPWAVHLPQPTSQHLFDASFLTPELGLAVGEKGTILRTQDAGETWIPQRSNTDQKLNRVCFQDRLRALAVGNSGTVLRSVDGGAIWTRQDLADSGTFTSIHFRTSDQGVLLLNDGTVFSTRDGGVTWTSQPKGSLVWMQDIHFLDSLIGFMVGSGKCLRTGDGGKTWIPVEVGNHPNLNDIHFLSPETGFITSATFMGGVLRTRNGGKDWTFTSLPNAETLRFFDTRHGYALGSQGVVGVTLDGGLTWTRPSHRPTFRAMRCLFTTPQSGFGFSDLGSIYRTKDGGARWLQRLETRLPGFSDLHFTPGGIGYGWGEIPREENHRDPDSADFDLYQTSDRGKTWTRLGVKTASYAHDLQFVTPSIGLAVGDTGKIWRTADGGKTWSLRSQATRMPISGLHCPTRDTCFAVGGHLGEPGILMKSLNGGLEWNRLASPIPDALLDVHFVTSRKGFAIVMDGILATRDGGLSWTRAASLDEASLQYLAFSDPANGHTIAISESRAFILKTSDGGETWVRLPVPDGTFAAAFPGADTGYAAGGDMEGNGFVARTVDGGMTWSSRIVAPFPLHRIYLPIPGEGFALNVYGAMVRQSGEGTVGIRRRMAPRASGAAFGAGYDMAGRKHRKTKRPF